LVGAAAGHRGEALGGRALNRDPVRFGQRFHLSHSSAGALIGH
jgi:hypothetical protein